MDNFIRRGAAVALSLSLLAGGVPEFAQGAERIPGKAEEVFDDVCAQDWFCPYVQYVYENGIMQGTSETTFSPYGHHDARHGGADSVQSGKRDGQYRRNGQ